ncbi:MAG: hypothetical protein OIF47_10655 [Marinibacterium sp.]|nr:hypothetical protein [Marinibacterium sp.]
MSVGSAVSRGLGMVWSLLKGGARFAPLALVVVIGLLFLSDRLSLRPPFAPFTTHGRIYVESPEVYTRERLVNDRYEQAYWLGEQLEKLDEAQNFTSTRRDLALRLSNTALSDSGAARLADMSEPPFDYTFQLKAALRDRMRQLILENQLDDRHDRTGNSVYGLKFDTTVLPGRNTRKRAFVRVRVVPENRPDADAIHEVFRHDSSWMMNNSDVLMGFPQYYRDWLHDIKWRLNTYLEGEVRVLGLPETGACAAPGSYDTVLREAISKVLSIDSHAIDLGQWSDSIDDTRAITLPDPWPKYLSLVLFRTGPCADQVAFDTSSVDDVLILVDMQAEDERAAPLTDEAWNTLLQRYLSLGVVTLDERPIEMYALRLPSIAGPRTPDEAAQISADEFLQISPKIELTPEIVEAIATSENGFPVCLVRSDGACGRQGMRYLVPSGIHNFVSDVLDIDSYLYAVFPKTDASGLLERSLVGGTASAGNTGPMGLNLSLSDATETSRAIATQVSFSDKGADDDIVFGWVIGADEIAQPTQKSQFVLISLPAYLTSVELEIQTGWLDRHSEFQYLDSDAPERIDVKLPPNFEAFDTLIIGERQTGPAIFTRLMDEIALEACKPGAVVIPGARLWRSTVVTMNGTMADRITVMPDMQGIVAHFNAVPANVPMDTAYPLTDEPTLHVWTSEGSDKLKGKIKVLTPGPCPAN